MKTVLTQKQIKDMNDIWYNECHFALIHPSYLKNTPFEGNYYLAIDHYLMYKEYNLPRYAILMNGYCSKYNHGYIAISVTKNPEILYQSTPHLNITNTDLNKAISLIKNNWKLFWDISDMKIDALDAFTHKLTTKKDIYETFNYTLNESIILKTNDTGINQTIWIDDLNTWKGSGYGPRLKVQGNKTVKSTRQWVSFGIPNGEVFNNEDENGKALISKRDILSIQRFIFYNRCILQEIIDATISEEKFKTAIIKINKKLNPIYPDKINDQLYPKIKDIIDEFVLVTNEKGEYNILNTKTDKLVFDKWLYQFATHYRVLNGYRFKGFDENYNPIEVEIYN